VVSSAAAYDAPLALLLLWGVAAWVFQETVESVIAAWTGPSPVYQSGLVILLVALLIAWREWSANAHALHIRASAGAVLLLALASFAWGLATLVAVEILQLYALLAVITFLPCALLGFASVRIVAFPLALLVPVWPVWEVLLPLLQGIAARAVATVLSWTGMPLHRMGAEIHVSSGVFVILPGCGGLTYMLSGILAALLFAYIERLRLLPTVAVTAGAALVALLANLVRIATVIYLGEATRMQHVFVTDDHSALGWSVFAVCTIAYLLVVRSLLPARSRTAQRPAPTAVVTPAARRHVWRSALFCLAAISIGPALAHLYRPGLQDASPVAIEPPVAIHGWSARVPSHAVERPVRLPADAEFSATYRHSDGATVTLHVADYAHQRPGGEAVSLANVIYDERYWKLVDTRILRLNDGTSVRETRLRSPHGAERLVWRWYLVGTRPTGRDHEAKALNVWGTLAGDPAVALVAVVADDTPGRADSADARLARFVDDTRDAVATAIRRGRDARQAER
jgi:EpsI family protein